MQSITLPRHADPRPQPGPGPAGEHRPALSPTGEKNLAAMAARRFWEALGRPAEDLDICIQKRIPCVLKWLAEAPTPPPSSGPLNQRAGSPPPRQSWHGWGEQVGSDVPYCVLGGTALAEGRGERLTRCPPCPAAGWWSASRSSPSPRRSSLPASTASACAAVPTQTACSPPWRKGTWGAARRMYNVFEDVLPRGSGTGWGAGKRTDPGRALGANMSGTGPNGLRPV